jgi:hypothetical protein
MGDKQNVRWEFEISRKTLENIDQFLRNNRGVSFNDFVEQALEEWLLKHDAKVAKNSKNESLSRTVSH